MKFVFVKQLSIFWNIMEYPVCENWKLKITELFGSVLTNLLFNFGIEMVLNLHSNTQEKMVGFDG
jgi:hypothetical protein